MLAWVVLWVTGAVNLRIIVSKSYYSASAQENRRDAEKQKRGFRRSERARERERESCYHAEMEYGVRMIAPSQGEHQQLLPKSFHRRPHHVDLQLQHRLHQTERAHRHLLLLSPYSSTDIAALHRRRHSWGKLRQGRRRLRVST